MAEKRSKIALFRTGERQKKRRKTSLLFCGESNLLGDLHENLLFKIFSHLSPAELFLEVSLVCNSWRQICWDAMFFQVPRTLDLSPVKSIVRHLCHNELPWKKNSKYSDKLLEAMECLLASPLEQRQELIMSVIFPRNMHISGLKELTFVAIRTPNLRRLVLPDGHELKEGCFSEALKHWKLMEEISIGPCFNNHMTHIIQELGTNCKNLIKLEINMRTLGTQNEQYFKLDTINAKLIAKHLINLKEFTMVRGQVYTKGVIVMLKECKQIMRLRFKGCYGISGHSLIEDVELKKEIELGSEDVKRSDGGRFDCF